MLGRLVSILFTLASMILVCLVNAELLSAADLQSKKKLPRSAALGSYGLSSHKNDQGLKICFRWVYFRAYTDQMVKEMGEEGEFYRKLNYIEQRDAAIDTYRRSMSFFRSALKSCCGRHEKFPGSCEIDKQLSWDFKLQPLKNRKVWGAPNWFSPNDIRFPSYIVNTRRGDKPFNPRLIFEDSTDFQCQSSGVKVLIGYPFDESHFWPIRYIGIGSGQAAMSLAHEFGHAGRYSHPAGGSHAPSKDRYNVMADGRWSQVDPARNYVDYQWCNSMATLLGYQSEKERQRNITRR